MITTDATVLMKNSEEKASENQKKNCKNTKIQEKPEPNLPRVVYVNH